MSQVENEVIEELTEVEEVQPSQEEQDAFMREWLYGNSEEPITVPQEEQPIDTNAEVRALKEQEILNLTSQLSSSTSPIGDWKIAKCYEYQLSGLEPPYNVTELHSKRQAVRDRINAIQAELV